jgi:L-alanine-DL-glutamate epimerase-like enolase superfamily enzyme
MKISAIRSWNVTVPWDHNPGTGEVRHAGEREFIFVQVDTDEGLTGWGEVTTYPGQVANIAVPAFIDQIGAWLVGEDPAHIERLWHKIFRSLT